MGSSALTPVLKILKTQKEREETIQELGSGLPELVLPLENGRKVCKPPPAFSQLFEQP